MPPPQALIPLNQFPLQRLAKVRCILGNSSLVSRLASSGVFVGFPILLHDRKSDGRVTASILDQRFEILEADCARILVETIPEPSSQKKKSEPEEALGRVDE